MCVDAHCAMASDGAVTERWSAPTRYLPGTRDQSGPDPNSTVPISAAEATTTTPARQLRPFLPMTRAASQPPTTTAMPKKMKVVARCPTSELIDDTLDARATG